MLVSLGAAIFTIISVSFAVDPVRIAAAIVTGIGFLGAGSIISTRGQMHGITTRCNFMDCCQHRSLCRGGSILDCSNRHGSSVYNITN